MNSRIYSGHLQHTRSHEVRHSFTYSLHLYALDLDELTALEQGSRWFGHNRIRPLALHDRDYLHHGTASLSDKINRVLTGNGLPAKPARTVLVTALRQFNYVFNPVSFFFCYQEQDRLMAVIAQVNNTFGETHLYLLRPGEDGGYGATKAFHVSPFFPESVRTGSRSPPGGESIELSITFLLHDKPALVARFTGTARQMTPGPWLGPCFSIRCAR